MQKTSNYNLNQWESTDPIRREDFNADNAAIDAALGGVPKIACGTYTGDGAASRTINLGFTPKAVFVVNAYGQMHSTNYFNGGLAVVDSPVIMSSSYKVVEIIDDGFCVYHNTSSSSSAYVFANANTVKYHYLAIG